MKKIIINEKDNGMTLIKYLRKLFPQMNEGLLHKLLRKKYFKVNSIKATGNEVLNTNDEIFIYLSNDTIDKYSFKETEVRKSARIDFDEIRDRIVYEDSNIIIFNKPYGMLSQGVDKEDISVNSLLRSYVSHNRERGIKDNLFIPSIVNRLDRNTEGLIIFAKNYISAKYLSLAISKSLIKKYYIALVYGIVKKDNDYLTNILTKDKINNIVSLKKYSAKNPLPEGYTKVELKYKVINRYEFTTLVEIELITGKSHQIRSQFLDIGHPLVGDKKYYLNTNNIYYEKNKLNIHKFAQRLVCYKVVFNNIDSKELKYLDGKEFVIENPLKSDLFKNLI